MDTNTPVSQVQSASDPNGVPAQPPGSPDGQKSQSQSILPPIPPIPESPSKKGKPVLPVAIIAGMVVLTAAAMVFRSQSFDVRSKAQYAPTPTVPVMPIYLMNQGTGQTCQQLCQTTYSGRNCVSVGTDGSATNAQAYIAQKPVCGVVSGQTCSTVMGRQGSCRVSKSSTALTMTAKATRCKCQ